AAESFGVEGGQALEGLFFGEDARGPEAVLAGEQVVELETDTIEGSFPPVVVGHHEAQVADQVRGVLKKQSALLEGFHDERDVALFEVTHAAMHQLGAAAGGALAEIALLEQEHVV